MISSGIKTALARPPVRAVGSKCRYLTTTTTNKKPSTPLSEGAAKLRGDTAAPKEMSANADWANPPDVIVEVTPQMKRNNVILATLLCAFVGGIWTYSMNAVGSQEQHSDDPLAQLKLEAQEAMDRQEKELNSEDKSKKLLEEFSRGEHDPDKAELDALEELEKMDAEDAKKQKKWYKFW
jgi:hypothetical protein